MKRMSRGRNPRRARPRKMEHRKSRNVKARANGVGAAAVEEAEETALLIAAQTIRHPAIAESAKSRRKQRRKSTANHGLKAGPNRAMIVTRAARNRAMNAL